MRRSSTRSLSAICCLEGLKDEMFDYYLAFLLSGIIGIYRTWALSDGSVPIERVSEVANDLTLNGLSSLESRLD